MYGISLFWPFLTIGPVADGSVLGVGYVILIASFRSYQLLELGLEMREILDRDLF